MEKVSGVALIIRSSSGIWVVEETQNKPQFGKRAGDWSIPMETCKPGESDHAALERLCREETPGIRMDTRFEPKFLCEVDICGAASVRVYVGVASSPDVRPIKIHDGEVESVGWKTVDGLLSHRTRAGVEEMLSAYRRQDPFLV